MPQPGHFSLLLLQFQSPLGHRVEYLNLWVNRNMERKSDDYDFKAPRFQGHLMYNCGNCKSGHSKWGTVGEQLHRLAPLAAG